MQIKLGSKVVTSDDSQVGTLSSVILFPGTKEVTHLGVRSGQDVNSQMFVPVDAVYSADEKHVVLRQQAEPGSELQEGTTSLKEGAKVISSDGQNVGTVARVTTSENRVVELLIVRGKLLKSYRMIQSDMISSFMEEEVRLTVDADFINSLPEPRPELSQL